MTNGVQNYQKQNFVKLIVSAREREDIDKDSNRDKEGK
jgi:hypothetical protein